MVQPATNPKIEELRFRLKADPKSRLFYQLAEELRRGAQYAEAEQILRQGLVAYPAYLAAWVSLGRVLREQKNDAAAVDALNTALQLDPGNVVAARLLADAYLALGEKVEAIKKYKLVHAILPADEEVLGMIERLERELQPPVVSAFEPAEEPEPELDAMLPAFAFEDANAFAETTETPLPAAPPGEFSATPGALSATRGVFSATPVAERDAFTEESPFDKTVPPFALDERDESESVAGDGEPMLLASDESPFEEPAPSAIADAFESGSPTGIQVDFAPMAEEVPAPGVALGVALDSGSLRDADMLADIPDESDVFAPVAPVPAPARQEVTDTLTMADLYARQGLVEDAKTIYEHLLARDPENAQIREKLAALTPAPASEIEAAPSSEMQAAASAGKVARLERWLAKVSKREVGRV